LCIGKRERGKDEFFFVQYEKGKEEELWTVVRGGGKGGGRRNSVQWLDVATEGYEEGILHSVNRRNS
jgi:hypothetical protein